MMDARELDPCDEVNPPPSVTVGSVRDLPGAIAGGWDMRGSQKERTVQALRVAVSIAIVVLMLVGQQLLGSVTETPVGNSELSSRPHDSGLVALALAQVDNDTADNDGGDNDDNASDDNDDNADDNDGDDTIDNDAGGDPDVVIENVSGPPASASPPQTTAVSPATSPSPTEASGTTTGGDTRIALPGDHVLVQAFPWMPRGITITVRLLDPTTVPVLPGTRVGDLVFQMAARDATGTLLAELPAEVNLSATYGDQDIAGRNEQGVALVWLDPADNQWKAAPKPATDPAANYVSASVTRLGSYAVTVR